MTSQEQQLLQGLTDRVNQTQLTDKDPEAEQFIFQNLGKNSDSLYILAQTVIVQQYALDQAKQQIGQLKQQLQQAQQQPVKHTSFLGSLLGTDEPAHPAPPPPPQQYAQNQYAPVPNYPPQQGYAPQPTGGGFFGGGGMQSGGSSFLRSAMTTATGVAAGVAAGALAFEGIESLMHGFGNHAGYGMGGFGEGGFGGGQPREEVINNYYGDSQPKGDLADRFSAAGDQPSSDIEDRRDDSQSFADTSSADDSSDFADDSSSDDSSSFDDSSDSGSSDDSSF